LIWLRDFPLALHSYLPAKQFCPSVQQEISKPVSTNFNITLYMEHPVCYIDHRGLKIPF